MDSVLKKELGIERGRGKRRLDERGGEGKWRWHLRLCLHSPWTLKTHRQCEETETSRACGRVAHLSKFQPPLFSCTVDNDNNLSGIHYCRNNVKHMYRGCWDNTCVDSKPSNGPVGADVCRTSSIR